MAIENQKLEYGQEVTEEGLTRIKHRNKVIKLADSSDGGWETVKQYQPNPLASESENENKLQKAEYRDYQEKIKMKQRILVERSLKQPIQRLLIRLCCLYTFFQHGHKVHVGSG